MPLTVVEFIALDESKIEEIEDSVLEELTPVLIEEFQTQNKAKGTKLAEKFVEYQMRKAALAAESAKAKEEEAAAAAEPEPEPELKGAADEPEQIIYYEFTNPLFIPTKTEGEGEGEGITQKRLTVKEIQTELVEYAETGKEISSKEFFCFDPESGKYKLACVVAVDIYNRLQTEQKKFERKQELYGNVEEGYEYINACAEVNEEVLSRIDQIKDEGIIPLGISAELQNKLDESLDNQLSEIEINQYRVLEIHNDSGLFPSTERTTTLQEPIDKASDILSPETPVNLINFAFYQVEDVEEEKERVAAEAEQAAAAARQEKEEAAAPQAAAAAAAQAAQAAAATQPAGTQAAAPKPAAAPTKRAEEKAAGLEILSAFDADSSARELYGQTLEALETQPS